MCYRFKNNLVILRRLITKTSFFGLTFIPNILTWMKRIERKNRRNFFISSFVSNKLELPNTIFKFDNFSWFSCFCQNFPRPHAFWPEHNDGELFENTMIPILYGSSVYDAH